MWALLLFFTTVVTPWCELHPDVLRRPQSPFRDLHSCQYPALSGAVVVATSGRGWRRVQGKESYPRHHGTHQVVLLGALQEKSFVPFVAREDHLHPLMGFQVDAPKHRPSPIQHFEHFVSLELNVDERAVCLGTVPLHGWWERAEDSAGMVCLCSCASQHFLLHQEAAWE